MRTKKKTENDCKLSVAACEELRVWKAAVCVSIHVLISPALGPQSSLVAAKSGIGSITSGVRQDTHFNANLEKHPEERWQSCLSLLSPLQAHTSAGFQVSQNLMFQVSFNPHSTRAPHGCRWIFLCSVSSSARWGFCPFPLSRGHRGLCHCSSPGGSCFSSEAELLNSALT